jgi:AcrR family transcriptional regulator
MARKADPSLEEHILNAALVLVDKEGISGLSMRSVAKISGTSTPTLYSRFKDHDDLTWAVVNRIQQELLALVSSCCSVQEIFRIYLGYISNHPRRYELLTTIRIPAWEEDRPRPVYEMVRERLQQQLGGTGEKVEPLAMAIFALIHGTATLNIAVGLKTRTALALNRASLAAIDRLVKSFPRK